MMRERLIELRSRLRAGQGPCAEIVPLARGEIYAFALIVALAAWVRLHDLDYNTAFNDESVNVLLGSDWLSGRIGHGVPSAISWNVGWYLFPMMAWCADRIGGIVAIRVMTGLLGIGTLLAVSGLARRLFGTREAIGAAALVAILAPFVSAGRIAFREAGTLAFLSIGLWVFLVAWERDSRRAWLGAAALTFAAFLCKHPIGVFLPPLIAIAAVASPRGRRWFAFALVAALAGYGLWHLQDMRDMWTLLRTTQILHAPRNQLTRIYFRERLDFWLLLLLSVVGVMIGSARVRGRLALLIGGALLFAYVNVSQRADYNTYKQASYCLLFLVPAGMYGLGTLTDRALQRSNVLRARLGPIAVPTLAQAMAIPLALAGRDWRVTRSDVPFAWPNASFQSTYLLAWASPDTRVLVDDQVLRYYLQPRYRQDQITDAYYFAYKGQVGAAAYRAAVSDGYFDVISLDGASFDASKEVRSAISGALEARYALAAHTVDSVGGGDIAVYRRRAPAPASPAADDGRLIIDGPASGAVFPSPNVLVTGSFGQARGDETLVLDVFTDRWYPQGEPTMADPETGRFTLPAYLGGEGPQRCHHMLRVRVFDRRHQLIATTAVADIVRAAPGEPTECAGA